MVRTLLVMCNPEEYMNGMVLYPTDDEINALQEAELRKEPKQKDFVRGMIQFAEKWDLAYQKLKLEPLKINETVLG